MRGAIDHTLHFNVRNPRFPQGTLRPSAHTLLFRDKDLPEVCAIAFGRCNAPISHVPIFGQLDVLEPKLIYLLSGKITLDFGSHDRRLTLFHLASIRIGACLDIFNLLPQAYKTFQDLCLTPGNKTGAIRRTGARVVKGTGVQTSTHRNRQIRERQWLVSNH